MAFWITKEGKKIKYEDLELNHLKNIVQYIENKAKTGFKFQFIGTNLMGKKIKCIATVFGENALLILKYYDLKNELNKRMGLKTIKKKKIKSMDEIMENAKITDEENNVISFLRQVIELHEKQQYDDQTDWMWK